MVRHPDAGAGHVRVRQRDIPFFVAAFWTYDQPPSRQIQFIGSVFAIDAVMLVLFAGVLGWI
ncbi:MAG: hypothetical protein U0R28_10070 [Candidatus Nanopelagicales bacterium]